MIVDIVQDWDGFEKLVAAIHETGGEIKVERDVKLTGKSGATRQIDILMTRQEGLYTDKYIIECKYWNTSIKRTHVENVAASVSDLNASRGILFTTRGYQAGAIAFAKHSGVEIFKVRELTNDEWGAPGRKVEFYIQYFYRTVRNPNFIELQSGNPPLVLMLRIGNDGSTSTPIAHSNRSLSGDTIEELIEGAVNKTFRKLLARDAFLVNHGEACTRYLSVNVNIDFKTPAVVTKDTVQHFISRISFELGIKLVQTQFVCDRFAVYDHALMVENCITQSLYFASRRQGQDKSVIKPVPVPLTSLAEPTDALQNHSVLRIVLNAWFDPKEMDGLREVDRPEILG